jgi:hypothetical protein
MGQDMKVRVIDIWAEGGWKIPVRLGVTQHPKEK